MADQRQNGQNGIFASLLEAITPERRPRKDGGARAYQRETEASLMQRVMAGETPPRPLLSGTPGDRLTREIVNSNRETARMSRGYPASAPAQARRSAYFANAAIEADREEAARTGLPLLSERSVGGVHLQDVRDAAGRRHRAGDVELVERQRSMREVLGDVSTQTGAPREYLEALIGHESSGDPKARASTSTATGWGQFIEDTWLGMVSRYGARYGEPELARAVTRENGRWRVSDADTKRRILALRTDPRWAAVMAGHQAQENAAALRSRLGRNVREGEVYLAHFVGDRDAAALIRAAERETRGRGVSGVSVVGREAAQANRPVFYNADGSPRSAREVLERQTRAFRNAMWPGGTRGPAP